MNDLQAMVPSLLALCRQAGALIERHYHAPGADRFQSKGDDSPLTHADIDSHHCLAAGLARIAPGVPLLSEESPPAELAGRRDWPECWVVDPLDGTKEFLGRTGEFTINIALVQQQRPVLGLIYLPLERRGYLGIPGRGAWRHDDGAQRRRIRTRTPQPGEPLVVLASRRHRGQRLADCLDWVTASWGQLERADSGSALKFCQLAEGKGDFYPRFSPCSEWDTAAGQALVEGAGGALVGLDGEPLRYNARRSLLSPDFLAWGEPGLGLWQDLLARQR